MARIKFLGLADTIRRQIENGELGAGERLPSYAELEARFGVTPNTINRALISLEQESLVVREQGRGVFVADRDRAGATLMRAAGSARAGAIGLLLHPIEESEQRAPYYQTLFDGVRNAALRHDTELVFLHQKSDISFARCDGIMTFGRGIAGVASRSPLGMPSVSLLEAGPGMASVTYDECGGIEQTARHLIELGHRRIGYMVAGSPAAAPRIESYRDTLRAAGIEAAPEWIKTLVAMPPVDPRQYFYGSGRATMRHWLAAGWEELGLTALLVQNDDTAAGAVEVLQNAGWSVPGDVSIAGFDGSDNVRYFRPRLTTVEVPLREIGARAVELLMQLVRNGRSGDASDSVVLPAPLKIRESTGRID